MDYKIVIDAGHGGDDPGASGNGIIEKDLTLQISKYMYDKFKQMGVPVKMVRTSDETVNPSERVERILDAYGNNSNVIVVSNHINAGGGDGAEVIYALRNTNELADLVLNELEKEGQNSRKAYQRRLPSDTSKDYYFIHRNTGVTEPIIVEYGFLDSSGDDVNQLKNDYDNFAEAVVRAVAEYIGIETSESSDYYTVQKGDSLWSIAKKFGTTVSELKRINNLTSNTLSIGQRLKVSEISDNSNGNTYIVKAGDTLYSIARNYGISVSQLMSYNDLSTSTLGIGQVLKIPNSDNSKNDNYVIYIVKAGDNLYTIARNYGTTVEELMDYNNLSSNLLSIGQQIKIPMLSMLNNYIVKPGDTLYSIARQYNTTVENIKNKNNLTGNTLSIGQKLVI